MPTASNQHNLTTMMFLFSFNSRYFKFSYDEILLIAILLDGFYILLKILSKLGSYHICLSFSAIVALEYLFLDKYYCD